MATEPKTVIRKTFGIKGVLKWDRPADWFRKIVEKSTWFIPKKVLMNYLTGSCLERKEMI